MAKRKYIETPEKMWDLFQQYRNEIKSNPIYVVEQKRGNTILPRDLSNVDAETIKESLNSTIQLPMQRPLTLEGFENWCADNEIIESIDQYFANYEKRYEEYVGICSRIKKVIRQDQIEGGMVGIYNPSITQRLNGLVEKKETEIKGSLNIPNVPDIGNR
jgi:hypothetical protein